MAAYSHYLGATVTVQYRLGDILLSATGVFVGDSGRSIFLEQHMEQRGRRNYFRWEIPYANVHAIEVLSAPVPEGAGELPDTAATPARAKAAAAGAGGTSVDAAGMLPLAGPPKTA